MSGGEGSIVQFDNVGLRYGTEREVLSDIVVHALSRAASISSPGRAARARPRCSGCSISRSGPRAG